MNTRRREPSRLVVALFAILGVLLHGLAAAQEAGATDTVSQRFQCGVANQQQQSTKPNNPFATVAILFRDDSVGCRQVEGVLAACQSLAKCRETVSFRLAGYRAESQGVRAIGNLINEKTDSVDVIIGPSDSGVFVRAAELVEWPEDRYVPIVSPVVTAAMGSDAAAAANSINSYRAWFFSANVNAQHRTNVMIDLLNRRKIQSLSVLYSDSEFSRQSEAAIRARFDAEGLKDYKAYRYENVPVAVSLLDGIIDERQGAIGILGLRSQIGAVVEAFETKNDSWNTYKPLLFTAIDVANLELPNVYYPVLKQARARGQDDVFALSYDTMVMIGQIIIRQSRQLDAEFTDTDFQGELASLLDTQSQKGELSGMQFDDFQNVAPLEVLSYGTASVVPLGTPMGAVQEIRAQFQARHDRFGHLMLINIALVVVIVLVLSAIDIQRTYIGNKRSIWLTWPFLLLVGFNIASALLVYLLLAESQQIRWDNTMAALVVAFGYAALLKSTILQTESGKRIGIQAIYEQFIEWLNTRIMLVKHERSAAIINFVAYRNTLHFLKRKLRSVYRFAESAEIQAELIAELDAQIEKLVANGDGNALIHQRIECATALMKLMKWKMLQKNRIVPYGIKRWEIVDPEILVDISAQHVFDTHTLPVIALSARVQELLQEEAETNEERAIKRNEELQAALAKSKHPQTDVYLYVRFLFMRYSGQARRLVAEGLLPADWPDRVPGLPRWRTLLGMKRNITAQSDAPAPDDDKALTETEAAAVLGTAGLWSKSKASRASPEEIVE